MIALVNVLTSVSKAHLNTGLMASWTAVLTAVLTVALMAVPTAVLMAALKAVQISVSKAHQKVVFIFPHMLRPPEKRKLIKNILCLQEQVYNINTPR